MYVSFIVLLDMNQMEKGRNLFWVGTVRVPLVQELSITVRMSPPSFGFWVLEEMLTISIYTSQLLIFLTKERYYVTKEKWAIFNASQGGHNCFYKKLKIDVGGEFILLFKKQNHTKIEDNLRY